MIPPAPIMFCGDHGRVARNMLADEAGDQPGFHVVAAADVDADQDLIGLAAVEIGHGIGLSRAMQPGRRPAGTRLRNRSYAASLN